MTFEWKILWIHKMVYFFVWFCIPSCNFHHMIKIANYQKGSILSLKKRKTKLYQKIVADSILWFLYVCDNQFESFVTYNLNGNLIWKFKVKKKGSGFFFFFLMKLSWCWKNLLGGTQVWRGAFLGNYMRKISWNSQKFTENWKNTLREFKMKAGTIQNSLFPNIRLKEDRIFMI